VLWRRKNDRSGALPVHSGRGTGDSAAMPRSEDRGIAEIDDY